MKQEWLKYAAKIDAMSPRERLMIFAAALVVVLYVIFMLFIDPAQTRRKVLQNQLNQQRVEIDALRIQTRALEQRLADPDAADRARRDDLRRQIAVIDDSLKDLQQSLVPAQRVNALLEDMLTRNPRLQLTALRTLPVAPLVARSEKPAAAGAPGGSAATPPAQPGKPDAGEGGVFKHGVEITLRGSYADLYDYLGRLEQLHWRMFWSRARLNATDYPRLTLTVTIYTLSLDKAWLEV